MTAAAALEAGRQLAESLMVDACTIKRPTGTTTDPESGEVTPAYDPVYDGKCRIQTNDPYEQRPSAGEHSFTVVRDILQVPMSVTGVLPGDVVKVTASALDPDLVGREWRVAGPSRKTHQTMRRFFISQPTEVSR